MRPIISALVAVALVACSETAEGPAPRPSPSTEVVPVSRVIDGDTIEVRLGGREVDVRLIGIDTPESVAPDQPIECYARRASAYTESRLEGEIVRLEFDVERLDRYGRTLAYVWVDDELFNETLVAEGYAVVTTFPPNVMYVDRFLVAQREARETGRGLWGECP